MDTLKNTRKRKPTVRQLKALDMIKDGIPKKTAMLKAGYSMASAVNPKSLTESIVGRAYNSPIIAKIEAERDRLIEELTTRNLSEEKYRDIIEGFDKMVKNHQLLTGGATENIAVKPITELFTTQEIEPSQDDNM